MNKNVKKTLMLAMFLGLAQFSCSPELVENDSMGIEGQTKLIQTAPNTTNLIQIPIINDTLFETGLRLMGTNSRNLQTGVFINPFGESTQDARWKLAEWGSRYGLSVDDKSIVGDTVFYQNEGKSAGFYRSEGKAVISLEVFGSNEYTSPRKKGESWPHLLLEQSMAEPVFLKTMNALDCKVQAKLVYDENHMNPTDFNPKLHTSQVPLFFMIKNQNEDSEDYGDGFWFGLPLHDHRYENKERYMAQDAGKATATRKFIFTLGTKELTPGTQGGNGTMKIDQDVLSKVMEGFETAKERGYLRGSAWGDMAITSINIGWEMPGTFDSRILLKGLSLNAYVQH